MRRLRFSDFELDTDTWELMRDGELLPLATQPAQVLGMLLSRAGETVPRHDLKQQIWGESFVEADQGLNSCIRKVRKQLGDDPNEPRFIKTLHGRGYRFIGRVEAVETRPTELRPALPKRLVDRRRTWSRAWLRWFGVGLAVLGAAFLWGRQAQIESRTESAGETPPRLVALLPLTGETPDLRDELRHGIPEQTVELVGRIDPSRLGVLAYSSSMALAGSGAADPAAVEQALGELSLLGVDYAMQGHVSRADEEAWVDVRLLDTESGDEVAEHRLGLWDPTAGGVGVADRLAAWLASELAPTHLPPAISAPPLEPRLYEEYLQGLHHLRAGGADGYSRAVESFGRVVEASPGHAASWTGLAEAELWTRWFGAEDPEAALERARSAAAQALALDDRQAGPYAILGYASLYVDFDVAAAERSFEAAVRREPGSARAQSWFAAWLSAVGRTDEALERAVLARRLDPLSMAVRADLCWLFNYARRFDEAVAACDAALALQPESGWSALGKIEALRNSGRLQEATAEALRLATSARDRNPDQPTPDIDSLDGFFAWMETRMATRGAYFHAASMAAVSGRHEAAVDHLDAAYAARDMLCVFAGVDPRFEALRADPGFRKRLKRWGFGPSPVAVRN